MTTAAAQILREKFSFTSSIAADIWSPKHNAKAYEWWYFDALSDDGRDAVVVIFLDNFIFSPRYNRRKGDKEKRRKGEIVGSSESNLQSRIPNPESKNVPAVAFTYYRDGKPVYRAINEFNADDFSTTEDAPSCRIGDNYFDFESAPYGSGYFISIKAKLKNNLQLEAQLEWVKQTESFMRQAISTPTA